MSSLTWGLDGCHLEADLEPVDHEGGEGLAVNVLRDDDQGTLGLGKKSIRYDPKHTNHSSFMMQFQLYFTTSVSPHGFVRQG